MLIDATELGLVGVQHCACDKHAGQPIPKRRTSPAMAIQSAMSLPLPPARVELVNGSPMLTLNGYPVLWFENGVRAREVRRGV